MKTLADQTVYQNVHKRAPTKVFLVFPLGSFPLNEVAEVAVTPKRNSAVRQSKNYQYLSESWSSEELSTP